LRATVEKTFADPKHIAEGHKMRLEMTPRSGAETTEFVASVAKLPPAVVERYRKAMDGCMPSAGRS
jgi:hypothetical protein